MIPKKTRVHVGGRMHFYPSDLLMLEAHAYYTSIYLVNGEKRMVATTLGKIEKRLPINSFIRANRSTLLNLNLVKTTKQLHPVMLIEMSNQKTIKVSRRRKQLLLEALL